MNDYLLHCRKCGAFLKVEACTSCKHCPDALLKSEFPDRQFRLEGHRGIWRFNWLPVRSRREESAAPVVYHSDVLGARLGLKHLFIAFNGFWPERGAGIETCTFKEFEAEVVLQNAREKGYGGLVVASAGNTARAFAYLSARTSFPVVIVVPRMCLNEMWYLKSASRVPTAVVKDGDYADAIDVAERIARVSGIPFEEGVRNVAKRDGLGVVLMESVATMGRLPDAYFQAVGSGAGAIATWEMAERFLRDGRFGERLPRLHLAQNLPFAPMFHAWQRGARSLAPEDLDPGLIEKISTRVLSSRYPAYAICGGVYDALTASGGNMYGITNDEMAKARTLFKELEGIDIVPAAAIAVAAVQKAVEAEEITSNEVILLNITGGGEEAIWNAGRAARVEGDFISKSITDEEIEELLWAVLKKN
jgi:cysteate synthase